MHNPKVYTMLVTTVALVLGTLFIVFVQVPLTPLNKNKIVESIYTYIVNEKGLKC